MKKIILVLVLSSLLLAQYNYRVDNTLTVGPGMVYKHVKVPEKLWNINILEIDLTNPMTRIETVKAKDAYIGRETTSSMAKRRSFEGHQVIGAINADFFSSEGIPINVQVIQGQVLRNPIGLSTIGFDQDQRPWLGMVAFSGEIIAKNGGHVIHRVNGVRNTDEVVLYNDFYGASTGTNQWGTEVALHPISPWIVNDTVWAVVDAKETLKGDMTIPQNGAVISAHGNAMTFFDNHVAVGDTLALVLNLSPALHRLKEMVGGYPKIVYRGENWADEGYQEEGGPGHAYQIHPRTAIGFNADSSKLYFFTVDGRKTGVYQGMTLPQLADVMIDFGVAYGLNLDGGGSTTFVLRDEIMNHPSDGSERPVANAVLAISTAPRGSFGAIQIEPDNIEVYFNSAYQFTVSGWDTYYNPYSIQMQNVRFSVDSSLGVIDNEGLFRATANGGSGYVFARYENAVDSAFVRVIAIEQIDLQPEFAVTDTLTSLELQVKGVAETGKTISIAASSLEWILTNPAIGYVQDEKFFGRAEGETQIIARLDTLADTVTVRVEIGTDQRTLDLLESIDGWELSGENIDLLHSALQVDSLKHTAGDYSLRLDYRYVYSGAQKADFYLKKKIAIYGVPEKIGVDFRSDGGYHKIYFVVSDNDGELFKTDMRGYLTDSTQFVAVAHPTTTFTPFESQFQFHYPIQLEYIWFRPGASVQEGDSVAGSVYLDYLRVEYPTVTSLIPLTQNRLPQTARLLPSYPNPFNPFTTIRFELPNPALVEVKIYDVQGRLVERLLKQQLASGVHQLRWQAASLPSGVYFCRVKTEGQSLVQKLVLIK
ncbi:hypothetical protein Calab_2248 [Caldithrix abyssi DSM 13497]|uniref:Por secretion system C-terminal sorting domain-containing protein n=1 Tax=Caldithrix abyssi DSM 13497 TaxID=880073 RepID=H1XWM0_CALAY|nr:phosphodiester glycosidase family protein [Caldithrix abyssi]APF17786.1 hypothetical protein Cabys_1037 [Caldithrix abyssi DSM 13497]EHO41858.1 hypothetical protein Calab_2248 [Caldithrix abyssi DSM 13497]